MTFGVQLRRPAGGFARDLQYGAYLQLNDITPHLHTLVAGNFQASFGQGLVLAPVFHAGKSRYVTSVGQQREGLRYYSSVDGQGLHGAGATLRWKWNKTTRLDVSAPHLPLARPLSITSITRNNWATVQVIPISTNANSILLMEESPPPGQTLGLRSVADVI